MKPQRALITQLIHSVGTKLSIAFHLPAPVVTTGNNPVQEFLRRANGQKDTPETQYPFFYLKPRAFNLNRQSYNPHRMAKSPLASQLGRLDDGTFIQMRLVPTLVTIEVGYVTNDSLEYEVWAANWIALAASGRIDFDFKYNGIKMGVFVELADQIEIPEIDQGEDINQIVGTTTLTLHGYVEMPGRPTEEIGTVSPKLSFSTTTATADPERFTTYAKVGPKTTVRDR